MRTRVKTSEEIENMRISGRFLAEILAIVAKATKPGVTTQQLNDLASDELRKRGVKPAFLNYHGFPGVICISVNDEIVHAIPSGRVIQEGDIVGLDFGVVYKGMITDSAVTIGVGRVSPQAEKLMKATETSLSNVINTIRSGVRVGDIGSIIENTITKAGFNIIHDLGGHGVGHELHEDPIIPNYGHAGTGEVLKTGMTVAIEPIVSVGSSEIELDSDGWTYRTKDGSLSAQFEHTILITDDGVEVLTQV